MAGYRLVLSLSESGLSPLKRYSCDAMQFTMKMNWLQHLTDVQLGWLFPKSTLKTCHGMAGAAQTPAAFELTHSVVAPDNGPTAPPSASASFLD